ncbi:hypothetical protein [Ktedonobacter robiniae]|uniref:Uncharacterized protein n=1 Tax=Ktedonobacter robiniae TaxID=2778365 RepID=A0ABQ3UZJ5_9CHLR|nr:hypothetical protein [Ktedonobacter robiniae]GHO58311.1 hypothetical protein KSB_67860 [Ktedonobacter robiniae]
MCYDTIVKKAGPVGSPVALPYSEGNCPAQKRSDPRQRQMKCIC